MSDRSGNTAAPLVIGAITNRLLTINTRARDVQRYLRPPLELIRSGHHLRLDQAPRGYEIFKLTDGCTKVVLHR